MINEEIEPINFERFILSANLTNFKNKCEFWDINGSSQKLAYLTHNYFRYFGKFPSTVAQRLIETYTSKKEDLVVDTMVGSGTTLVEAKIVNRDAIGFDVNPFSILLSNVKVTSLDPKKLEDIHSTIKQKLTKLSESEVKGLIPEMKNMDHWFDKKVQIELAKIKFAINQIENKKIKEFFQVCFASILRRVSCAGSQTGRIFHDKDWIYRSSFELFDKQFKLMLERMIELNKLKTTSIIAKVGDAKAVPLDDNSAKLVICHPPYYNLYKFSHTNKFELIWLNYDITSVSKKEIFEGFKLGNVERHIEYLDEMYQVINEMHRIMQKGGFGALMLGDSIVQKQRITIAEKIVKYLIKSNIKIEKIILRKPRFAEASYATSQRRTKEDLGHDLTDFIIIFRK